LLLWVVVVALLHFDRGATTVAAMDVTDRHGASFGYAVSLLAWHSVGLAVGSVMAGAAFQQASAKAVLVLALLLDAVVLFVLGAQQQVGVVVTAALRFVSGLAASLPLIFLPLWVDEFAPSQANAQWLALMQMGAPLGQFVGVVVAATVTATARSSNGLDWHFAVFIQALLMIPLILRLALVPATQVDVKNIATMRARLDSLTLYLAEGSQLGHFHGVLRELREMLGGVSRNPLTVSVSTTLCFLHATATGLTLWAAPYLYMSPGAPSKTATQMLVAMTLAIAPTIGTYVGALLCDRMEGFKAGHHAAALRVACGFIAVAALAGPLSGSMGNFVARLGVMWFWLFGAGAFLPISVGILMTSMPSYLRSFASAASLLIFQLVSFAAVPIISAVLMSLFRSVEEGLTFGVSFALWMTVPAAVLLFLAYVREPKCAVPTGLSGVDDLTFSDISYELSRRRMTTAPL